jgi:hypothetical protein
VRDHEILLEKGGKTKKNKATVVESLQLLRREGGRKARTQKEEKSKRDKSNPLRKKKETKRKRIRGSDKERTERVEVCSLYLV